MLDFLTIYQSNNDPINSAVVDAFIDKRVSGCIFDYTQACYALSPKRDRFILFCAGPTLNRHVSRLQNGDGFEFFDGLVYQNKRVCHDIRQLSQLSENAHTGSGAWGQYCYGLFSEQGPNHFHANATGSYVLFVGWHDGRFVISNNAHLAAQALYPDSYSRKKNISSMTYSLIYPGPMDLSTPYQGVYMLPNLAGVVIGENNHAEMYSVDSNFFKKTSIEERAFLLTGVQQDMINYVALAAAQPEESRLGSLTGGFDSRIALAAAVAAGVHQKFSFFVSGHETHPDVVVAQLLAKEFGLNLTVLPGVNVIPEMDSATFTANFEYAVYGSYGLRYPHDAHPFGTLAETYGRRYPLDIRNSPPQPNDSMQLTLAGVGGESFKGAVSRNHHTRQPSWPIGRATKKQMLGLQRPFITMMRSDALARHVKIYENICKNFKTAYDLDLIQRGKRWTYHDSIKRYEWVYAYQGLCLGNHAALAKAATSGPPEYRGAYKYNFMLIDAFCPKLLSLPFAEKVWSEFAFYNHPDALKISQVKAILNSGVSVSSIFQKRAYVEAMASKYLDDLHDDFGEIFDMDKFVPYYSELKKKLRTSTLTNPEEDGIATEIIRICFMNIFMKTSYQIPSSAAPKSKPLDIQEIEGMEMRYTMPSNCRTESVEYLLEPGRVFPFPEDGYGPASYDALAENEQFFIDTVRAKNTHKQEIEECQTQHTRALDQLRKQVAHEKNLRAKLKKSFSWRITAPLRTMGHLVKGKKVD